MRQFFFPTGDVTLYEEYPNKQTGLDEILEVGKGDTGVYSSRALIEFDITSISESISSSAIPKSAEFDIKLFVASADRMNMDQIVALYPVSQSWVEGQGYFYQDSYVETKGATWRYRDTGSMWASSGSSYITSTELSASVANPISDLTFNATALVRLWVSGTISNYGVVSKMSGADEADRSNTGLIRFFSRNTHTVYSPILIAKWDDSSYSTGSLSAAPTTGLTVFPSNLCPIYKQNELVRIDIVARAQYPTKSFSTIFTAWDNTYLPATSYFSIIDAQSGEVIIPFDGYSKISVDSTGNFVKFRIEKMFPLRYYNLLFKVVTSDGYEYIFDNGYRFTVGV